ncbi:MAG: CDP-alcohol phosphatidyltransferase [Rhodospirillaceae bacterium]|nr:MAG: CDP-alcohol phosphatidyltransferase [Rhodospirillaceae bacterium]
MKNPPFDQRLARILVRPLVHTPVSPNHLTALTLVLALAGGGLLAMGQDVAGAAVFVTARFLDHFDGELARQSGRKSRFGYYFDYVSGGLGYAALFGGACFGLSAGVLGGWAIVLGMGGVVSAFLSMGLNLRLDVALGGAVDGTAVGYPGMAGFELEDGIYLLLPVAWLGWLAPFFVAAGIGAILYCLWTLATVLRLRARWKV